MAKSQRSSRLGLFLKLVGITPGAGSRQDANNLPYRLRDKFLSPAELAVYRDFDVATVTRRWTTFWRTQLLLQ